MLQARQIREAQIQLLHVVLLCEREDVFRSFRYIAHHYIIIVRESKRRIEILNEGDKARGVSKLTF